MGGLRDWLGYEWGMVRQAGRDCKPSWTKEFGGAAILSVVAMIAADSPKSVSVSGAFRRLTVGAVVYFVFHLVRAPWLDHKKKADYIKWLEPRKEKRDE